MRILPVILALGLFAFEPAAALADDPVTLFSSDDAEMNAAMKRARTSLPAFLERAAGADLTQGAHLVKVKVPNPANDGEHIWVVLLGIGDPMQGVLANEPDAFEGRVGDPIRFTQAQISDWSDWDENGKLRGNYTTRVMLTRMPPEDAEQLRAILAEE